jgi:hypothetical protein
LVAGGLDRLGGSVVLVGLPDDRVAVVLAAVVHGHPDPEGESGFPLPDRLAAVVVVLVGRDAVVGVELVEGAFAVADEVPGAFGVGVSELGGQAGVVVAVAGVQVAAEAAGDLVNRPVAELMTAEGSRGLQVLQQLAVAGDGVAGRVWRSGWVGV